MRAIIEICTNAARRHILGPEAGRKLENRKTTIAHLVFFPFSEVHSKHQNNNAGMYVVEIFKCIHVHKKFDIRPPNMLVHLVVCLLYWQIFVGMFSRKGNATVGVGGDS